MSKILWWLFVIIFAMFENVTPFTMPEQSLIINGYYTSTLGREDPASIYQSFRSGEDEDAYYQCNVYPHEPTAVQANSRVIVGVGNVFTFPIYGVNNRDYSGNIEDGDLVPIVAPFDCELVTGPEQSVNSTYMKVKAKSGNYVLTIQNMDHWYCCDNHKANDLGIWQHYYVTSKSYPDKIPQGSLLGFATKDTRLFFTKNEKETAFADLGFGWEDAKDCLLDGNRVIEES